MSNPESTTIRFLRLRNPECATPSVTMAAAQQHSSPSVLAMPILTATPRRGPSRFLKVLCPISNPTPGPYVEPDEYISDSIDDEPATPFAPLQNRSFSYSPLRNRTFARSTPKLSQSFQSPKSSRIVRQQQQSVHNSPGIENVDTEIFSQSLSSTPGRQKKPADWVKVRKKLPLVLDNNPEPQFEMPEPAIQESDPNETFTPFASDSPFFKVPLPPKPVKRPFRLKPRKKEELASSASETEQELHSEEEVPKVNQKGGLEDLYEKARYLVNWVPRMKSKKMIVEGDLLTLGSLSKKKNLPDDRWFTSRVIDRLKPNLILTKSGPYVLEGKMNYQAALQINAPQYIMTAFKNGFPADWDHFRQEWRRFILQQRENEETISLCSTTMNSEQSHYLQATVSKSSKIVDDEDDELVICRPRKNRFKKQMSGESELDEIENNVSSNVMKVKVQVHHTANKSNDLSLSETSFEKVVDKRKRKSKEFSDDEKKVVVKKKSRNRSKSNNEEESITSIVMPAKRGRPPKCSKQREEVDVQSLSQVDRRGRPTKNSEREKSILQENTIAKSKVSQEESIVSIVMSAKRGRPPKSSKPKELDVDMQSSRQVDKSVDSSKARRGRPPKSSEREKSTLQNAEVSHEALKKNCRSKMGKDTIEKTVIENVDYKQEKRTKSSERNKPVKEKKRKSIEKVQSEKDSKRGRHQSKSTERETQRKSLEVVNEQPEKSKPTKKENKTEKNVEKQNESPKRGGTRNQSKSAERENKRKSSDNQEIFKEKTEKSKPTKKENKKEKIVEKMPKKESPKRRGTRNQSKSTERENRKKSLANQEIFIEKTEKSKPTKKDTSEAAPKRKGRPPKNSKQGSVPSPGRDNTSDNSVITNISVASKSRGRPRKSENEKKTNKKKVSKEPLPPYAAFKPKESMQENSNKVKKAKKEELHVKDLKSKPKSLKDAKKNEEILKAHNNDHQDDLFKAKKTTKKTAKKDTGKRASDILAEIFHDSDSEQNLSLHSAKTPILAFIDRSKTVQPEEDFEEDFEPRFQEQAFFARKTKEAKKSHKLMRTMVHSPLNLKKNEQKMNKKMLKDTATVSRFSQEILQSQDLDEEDSDVDEYFTDMEETNSINNPPSGLMSLLRK